MNYSTDTIAAISTAVSNSGIGIVRISGDDAFDIINRIFRPVRDKDMREVPGYSIHYGNIVDDGQIVDEVLVMIMRAPHTYTRENTAEINCHGGVFVLNRILDIVLKNGARLAEMEGTTRTISAEMRQLMRERIDELCDSIARLSGATAEVVWTGICSALYNDAPSCAEMAEVVQSQLGLAVTDARALSLGGDNFAEFLDVVPGCYAYLGTANPAKPNTSAGLHTSCFDLDEDALPYGAALYAAAALHWLEN